MSNLALIRNWSIGVVLWAVVCAGGWYAATRDDYATLATALACRDLTQQQRAENQRCDQIGPTDGEVAKAAVDRKAAISRLAAALAPAAAFALWLVRRRRRG